MSSEEEEEEEEGADFVSGCHNSPEIMSHLSEKLFWWFSLFLCVCWFWSSSGLKKGFLSTFLTMPEF